MVSYNVPYSILECLKEPWGQLFKSPINFNLINDEIKKSNLIVTVGDASAETITSSGISPDIFIVDSLEKREKRNIPQLFYNTELNAVNPPSTITDQSLHAINSALTAKKPVRILIEGEEDLLSLLVIGSYPENTLLFYGQPNEGLVMVNVSHKKKEALSILKTLGITISGDENNVNRN